MSKKYKNCRERFTYKQKDKNQKELDEIFKKIKLEQFKKKSSKYY